MKKNRYGVIDPEAMLRGNIQMWRNQGHSDWHIGKVLMHPRLKTPEQFAYWGLTWNPPDGSALSPPDTAHMVRKL